MLHSSLSGEITGQVLLLSLYFPTWFAYIYVYIHAYMHTCTHIFNADVGHSHSHSFPDCRGCSRDECGREISLTSDAPEKCAHSLLCWVFPLNCQVELPASQHHVAERDYLSSGLQWVTKCYFHTTFCILYLFYDQCVKNNFIYCRHRIQFLRWVVVPPRDPLERRDDASFPFSPWSEEHEQQHNNLNAILCFNHIIIEHIMKNKVFQAE